jgi:hypothetical protein
MDPREATALGENIARAKADAPFVAGSRSSDPKVRMSSNNICPSKKRAIRPTSGRAHSASIAVFPMIRRFVSTILVPDRDEAAAA